MLRVLAIFVCSLAAALPATAQAITAKELLAELGFASDVESQVLAGKLVRSSIKATNERELAAGLVFFVDLAPAKLVEKLEHGLLMSIDANSKHHGDLDDDASVAQLSPLQLSPDQVKLYANAKAGEDLNLSASEISAFQELSGKPAAAIEQQMRKTLIARLAAYRADGLDGIAPYQRDDGKQTPAAGDLKSATEAASALKKHAPNFFDVMNHYPKGKAGITEKYTWQDYEAHGEPVVILTHAFMATEGDAFVVCQRQFYVSRSYNVEQAIAGLLPVENGTLVAYVNRTSTDQVTGFGGGSKRAIGSRVLASQLEDLFAKLQSAAGK